MLTATTISDTTGDERFRLAMVSTATGMAILDLEGRWLEVNPALERLLGREASVLRGQDLTASLPRDDAARVGDAIARLASGAASGLDTEVQFPRDDGSEFRAHLDIDTMRDDAGRAVYLVAHVHATGASAAPGQDSRIAALEQQLAGATAAFASLNHLQESFAQGVSHDLRAPLRAIDSFSALLASHLGDDLDETARSHLGRIRGATQRMSTLIDALLELSRAMRAELHLAPVDLGFLVDWVHAELADAEPGRSAEVVVQPGLHVLGDERQLKQLMTQLLHNAWKFSRERDSVRIGVSGERNGDRLLLVVRDQGSGFDMRYADKLFEPFQRLHGPEQAGGNGIGLAIVRCIVERHGGRAWAHSEPGTGSAFFVELPAIPDADGDNK